MNFKKLIPSFFTTSTDSVESTAVEPIEQTEVVKGPESSYGGGQWWPVVTNNWDGEKTPGELGVVNVNIPDHTRLRYRSYDAYDKIDTIKNIAGTFFKYIVGSGLKIQVEPNVKVLKLEGVSDDLTKFSDDTQARFNVWANSKFSSYNGMVDLHDSAADGFKTAFLGGDVLVVNRIEKGNLTVEVIDGQHIVQPYFDNDHLKAVKARGNFVKHGIEYNDKRQHIGFFVNVKSKDSFITETLYIPAKGKTTGRTLAWMVYGDKQRIDHLRGIPKTAAIIEKANKLDRYSEAAVGKAEEAANLMMAIEHTVDSTGENPFAKAMTKKLNAGGAEESVSSYELADGVANKITQSTSKTAVNLPQGASLKSFNTDIETKFEGFHSAIFDTLSASADVPPEVALQKYSSNYSASRAAIGAWEYVVDINRGNFSKNFYKPIYSLWLEVEVLKNKISAPGLIKGMNEKNLMLIAAYSGCRFIGKKMAHIDPLKEVKAARAILGDDVTPLGSREQVTEALNLGDWSENFKNFEKESKMIPKPIVEPSPPANK